MKQIKNSREDNNLKTIYLVDDEPDILELILKEISSAEYKIFSFMTGKGVIQAVNKGQPDLILLDYNLPDMTAKEIINELNFNQSRVPFVIMTGYGSENIAVEMMKLGAKDYLVKSLGFLKLLPALIEKVLKQIEVENKLEISKKSLEQNEKRFRDIYKNLPISYQSLDENALFVEVNEAWLNMFGYSKAEIIGKSFTDFLVADQKESFEKSFSDFKSLGEICAKEYHMVKKDGGRLIVAYDSKIGYNPESEQRTHCILYDITKQKQVEKEIIRSKEELQNLSNQLIKAQEIERQRISQELHDEIGQALTSVKFNLTAINREMESGDYDKIKIRMKDSFSILEQLMKQVHDLTLKLRPGMLDDLGLVPTLRWFLTSFEQRTNIKVRLNVVGEEERFNKEIESNLYRIIQEAMNNISKHAQASLSTVQLSRHNSTLDVLIEDNGKGFDAEKISSYITAKHRIGLIGMRERVNLLRGSLNIQTFPGEGTKIYINIPSGDNK